MGISFIEWRRGTLAARKKLVSARGITCIARWASNCLEEKIMRQSRLIAMATSIILAAALSAPAFGATPRRPSDRLGRIAAGSIARYSDWQSGDSSDAGCFLQAR